MSSSQGYRDFDYAMDALASGDKVRLCELEKLLDDFPDGIDEFIGRRWIINAIEKGAKASIEWILSRDVDLSFDDKWGVTVLHAALERTSDDKHEVLETLLKHGAPTNVHGGNDWTPAHLAAHQEDIEALELLIRYGADMSVRTRIDDYATPLEEARNLKKWRAVEFLEKRR